MFVCFEFPIVFFKKIYFYFFVFLAYNFVLGLCYKKKESGSFLIFGRSVREFSSFFFFFLRKKGDGGGMMGRNWLCFKKKPRAVCPVVLFLYTSRHSLFFFYVNPVRSGNNRSREPSSCGRGGIRPIFHSLFSFFSSRIPLTLVPNSSRRRK